MYRNSFEEVREAISSFLNTTLNVKLYVLDNSPDNTIGQLCIDRRIEYIHNGKNLGFGAAHNLAMRIALTRAQFHLVLNPDVYFSRGVLEELFTFVSSQSRIGLLMPRVLYPDGSTQHLCKRLPTPSDLLLRRFLPKILSPLFQERLAKYELRDAGYNKTMSVPALSGCFMLLSCVALAEVGIFDERFFMYLEDVDLCRRIHREFPTIYFPEVSIYHRYSKGSYRKIPLMLHHLMSAWRYFQKWGWFHDVERTRINRNQPREIKELVGEP